MRNFASNILLILLILVCNTLILKAQFYTTGAPPPGINWKIIKTEYVQLIFDETVEKQAQQIVSQLNIIVPYLSAKANVKPKRISVILHNHTVQSNGFVSFAPKRMELVLTPPADDLSTNWFEHLSVHEMQHVIQIQSVNRGITKILSILFGDAAHALISAYLPFWFLEGQAVYSETAFSPAGRGTQGSFLQETKAMAQNPPSNLSLEKTYFKSYKYYVPDHYHTGYEMVNYAATTYNDSLWDNISKFTGQRPYTLFPFYFGLKKHTGLSKSKLSDVTWQNLKTQWDNYDAAHNSKEYTPINRNRNYKEIISYQYPVVLNNEGDILAQKESYDDITRFVLIDKNGNEKTIYIPGLLNNVKLSSGGDYIAWTEYMPDLEYTKRDYSDIILYNYKAGERKRLSVNGKYFAPSLNKTGDKLAALCYDEFGNKSIDILNVPYGNIIQRIEFAKGEMPQYPTWSANENKIYFTLLLDNKKYVAEYSLTDNKQMLLYNFENYNISGLEHWGDYLLFSADFDTLNQIYALNLKDKKIYQTTQAKNGAYDPSVNPEKNKLYFSNYTYKGYDIASINIAPFEWQTYTFNKQAVKQVFSLHDSVKLSPQQFDVKDYKQWKHLFRPHTWTPFYFDYSSPENLIYSIKPGVQIFSQNLLETLISTASVRYDNESFIFETGFLYKGIKPYINYSFSYGGVYESSIASQSIRPISHTLDVSYPLNFTQNKYTRYLQPSITLNYRERYVQVGEYEIPLNSTLDFNVGFYNYLKMAKRDIYPRWGQSVYVNHRIAPYNSSFNGSTTRIYSNAFFPGIFKNDGFLLSGTYKFYAFATIRGYAPLWAKHLLTGSVNYTFPILYPDFNVWRLSYIKRIRANLFYDHALAQSFQGDKTQLSSTGVELLADIHMLHLFFPLTTGVQATYSFLGNTVYIGPVFRIDLGFPK